MIWMSSYLWIRDVAFIQKYGNFSLLSYIVRGRKIRRWVQSFDSSCSSQQGHNISTHTVSVVRVRLQKMAKPQDDLSFDMLTHLSTAAPVSYLALPTLVNLRYLPLSSSSNMRIFSWIGARKDFRSLQIRVLSLDVRSLLSLNLTCNWQTPKKKR
jgi:hypothetical protein